MEVLTIFLLIIDINLLKVYINKEQVMTCPQKHEKISSCYPNKHRDISLLTYLLNIVATLYTYILQMLKQMLQSHK